MAKATIWESDVRLEISMTLGEKEARALKALTDYGTDQFLMTFYEKMGKSCLQPHEAGLRSLFDAVRGEVTPMLGRADAARKAFRGQP